MSFCVELVSEDSFYENITLGVTKLLVPGGPAVNIAHRPLERENQFVERYLCRTLVCIRKYDDCRCAIFTAGHCTKEILIPESDPRICNVNVERRIPCDRLALSTWEQRHSAVLPEDLRNFYASSDGFRLTWYYKYSADQTLPVGSIRVNSLSELFLSPALKDLLDFALTRQSAGPRPVLNNKSKVFELDSCRTIGKVCLVFTNGEWSVWLATREGVWGWLADSFTHYFRMSLVHLGLPGWQAAFANLPLMPWAEQLFLLLAPHLLGKVENDDSSETSQTEAALNHIDPNIFKISVRQHKNLTRQTNA